MLASATNALRSFYALRAIWLSLTLLLALPATAAVTLDATSEIAEPAGTTSFTFPHVLGTGGNRLVVCTVAMSYPAGTITQFTPTVTFGNVPMTPVAQSPGSSQNSPRVEGVMFWANDNSVSNPAGSTLSNLSGSTTVSVTVSNANVAIVAGCSSYFGVLQTGTIPESFGVSYSGNSTVAAAIPLTVSGPGDLVVDSLVGGYTAGSTAKTDNPSAPQIALYPSALYPTAPSTYGVFGGSSYQIVTSGTSVSPSWFAPATNSPSRSTYSAIAFAAAPSTNYTVTTVVSPASSGTVTLSPAGGSYASGSSVQFTANPAVGYVFSSFSGDLVSTSNPASLTINGNKSVTANFTPTLCTLSTNVVGSGSITLSPTASGNAYVCGTQVQVTAVPGSGYSFGNFSGALTGSTNPQTLVVNTSTSVTATFTAGTSCTLATSTTGSGTITVSPAGTVFSCGTSLTITAVPAQYYSLTGFSGAITGTTNPQTYIINANSSIAAAFTQTSFPINTTIVGPGTVTANPADTGSGYAPGTQVALTATPAAGASFTGFSGDLTGTTNPQTLTVNDTANVTATFLASTITQDAVSHGATTANASTLSWKHVLGSGTSRAVVIAVGQTDTLASPDASSVVTSVLFNGVYATPVPNSIIYGGTSGSVQSQLFYLLEPELPAAGTYTITVTLAGSVGGLQAGAVSFINVNQAGPEAVITHRDTTGADLISTAITTLTNNAVVVDTVEDNNVAALTANTGQTVAWTASSAIGSGGSSVKFVPTAGSTTLGWAGSASRLTHSLAAFPPATASVPPTYTLATSIAGGVGGTVTTNPGLTNYPVSTGVLLTAVAQTGYVFSSWSGDYSSTANPLPITMDTNRNVVANFSPTATCTLALNIVGSGTVTPAAGTYNCGTVLHFVATPASGYNFTSYSGDFSSSDNPTDFTLSANANVTVEFDPIVYCNLNITAANGTVSPGSGNFTCGSVVNLQATANSGYAFSGYTGDINTTANPATIQLNQSTTNVTANFTAGSGCALTSSITSGVGTISPSSGSWACGTVIAIEADPASKYSFTGWGGALAGSVTSPTTLTMSANEAVSASFVVNSSGVTGDSRIVTEPTYPPVCTVLTAVQTIGSLVESSPDTARVQAALNACPVGQAVQFSSNGTANAFIIQPITLPAGVTMIVDPEITIFGSITSTDYPCTSSSFCKPLIDVASNTAPNPGSAIMGDGVIDGRGGTILTDLHKSWWGTGSDARPRLVYLSVNTSTAPADNFTMYKITLKNSPKFEFSGIGNNLTIWGVKVIAPPDSPNTDGIDPSSSQNITITNSYVSTGDDMIAMKAGNGHIANVTISNNHMYSGHGITIGSETNAGLNNMLVIGDVIDNGFGGSSADSLRIKSDTSRGGEVYDVLYKNICIKNGGDTIVIDPYYSSQTGSLIPNFHDITFQNVHKTVHNSSYKSTFTGYNTNGIVNPLTVTFDTVYFDGDAQNDFKAPDNVNNAQFTFGPGPFSAASFFAVDAATPSNFVTVTNSVVNSNAALDCSAAFVYLAGDLTAPTSTVTAGTSPILTAVLQNVVSPLVAGTISYPQQNAPTGTIQVLEGTNVVGSGTINGRIAYITVPNITVGTHIYTAKYLGDGNFATLAYGSFTMTAINAPPVANAQTITVPFNTATSVTLTATGSGTLIYSVVGNPAHGSLSGTPPSLTYTPTTSYFGVDSFTFKANNGSDSNTATITLNVQNGSGGGSASQAITFPQPPTPVTYFNGESVTLTATSSAGAGYPVAYSVSGPAFLTGSTLTYTGPGTVVVTANQAGDANYTAAAPVQVSITVLAKVPGVFIANLNGTVSSLTSNGSQQSTAMGGGGIGVAVDSSGYVWSINSSGNGLSEFSDAGAFVQSLSPSGITGATALAFDGNSNLLITNGNGSVSTLSNGGAVLSNAAGSTTMAPSAIAIDISGNVWVTNRAAGTIDEIIGGAAPAAPLATAVTNSTMGVRP